MPIPQKKERRGANLSISRPALSPIVEKSTDVHMNYLNYLYNFIRICTFSTTGIITQEKITKLQYIDIYIP